MPWFGYSLVIAEGGAALTTEERIQLMAWEEVKLSDKRDLSSGLELVRVECGRKCRQCVAQ